MFKMIVVPVDGSETSKRAVNIAVDFGFDQKATLIFCHAVEEIAIISAASVPPIDSTYAIEQARAYGASVLDAAAQLAKARGVSYQVESSDDTAVTLILRLAKEKKTDLIVMGTHGRRGLERAIMGSTTEGVLRESPVPVLVIRDPGPSKR